MEQQNEQLSRSERVKLAPAMAKMLKANMARIQQIQQTMQVMHAADQSVIEALAEDAGFKLNEFQRWEYEEKDGVTTLVLVPAPLPPPTEPVRPEPVQEG